MEAEMRMKTKSFFILIKFDDKSMCKTANISLQPEPTVYLLGR